MRAISFALLVAVSSFAAPPKLEIPSEKLKPVAGYVRFAPETTAKSVTYVPLDDAYPFPSEELKDGRRFVLPVAGLKPGKYRFVAVGTLNDEQTATGFEIVIDGSPEPKPSPSTTKVCVVIVEESQARTPAQGKVIADSGLRKWLKDGGHQILTVDKDDPQSGAAGYGPYLTQGLPTVILIDATATTPRKPLAYFQLPATATELQTKIQEVLK